MFQQAIQQYFNKLLNIFSPPVLLGGGSGQSSWVSAWQINPSEPEDIPVWVQSGKQKNYEAENWVMCCLANWVEFGCSLEPMTRNIGTLNNPSSSNAEHLKSFVMK